MKPHPQDVERILTSVAASYAKRWLEGNFYDWLFTTAPGRWARGLDPGTKYAIEAGMYVAAASVVPQPGDSTGLSEIALQVLSDAAPELAKRIINGQKPPEGTRPSLPEVSDTDMETIRAWVANSSRDEREALLRRMTARSTEASSAHAEGHAGGVGSTMGETPSSGGAVAVQLRLARRRVNAARLRRSAARRGKPSDA